MAYSQKRKLGRRKVEAAAEQIGTVAGRLRLMEEIVVQLLARENLHVGMDPKTGTVVLVPAPPLADTADDCTMKVLGPDPEGEQ